MNWCAAHTSTTRARRASMSTAVDVARAGVADAIPVDPSSPLAKKRAPARRDVVPSDEVDVAVEGTPAPITAEAPAGKKRARSPDDSPVRPMRSLEDARDESPPVRARRADASPRHPAALHPSTDEDADRLLVSLAVSAVRGVVAAPRGERASVSLDALRPRNPENTPAYLEVVRAFDTLRRELDLADADPREARGEPDAAAANLDVPSNEPSEMADVTNDGRLRPWEVRIAEETRADSERREASARRECELSRREAMVLSRESERARLETVARELAVSLASVEKERAAAEASVRTARRETEEARAQIADALARAVAAEKRAAAARDAVSAAERRLEEAAASNAKETKTDAKTGALIDPRRALEFKRHLATHMKRLDGEAASLTSILESGGGFTATEALAALGEMCEDAPDGRAATHMVVVHEI